MYCIFKYIYEYLKMMNHLNRSIQIFSKLFIIKKKKNVLKTFQICMV